MLKSWDKLALLELLECNMLFPSMDLGRRHLRFYTLRPMKRKGTGWAREAFRQQSIPGHLCQPYGELRAE